MKCTLLLCCALTGCAFFQPEIGVREAGSQRVYDSLNANALNRDELSAATREILHAYGLTELADDQPLEALRALHACVVAEPARVSLYALAEFSFFLGADHEDRDLYLASAFYAYRYLLGDEAAYPPNPYDRRFRWACDLYNLAVERAFLRENKGFVPEGGRRELPVGSIEVGVDDTQVLGGAAAFEEMLPADDYMLRGLSLRLRDSGLGAPLIGIPAVQGVTKAPLTAFLRVEGSLADLEAGVQATLELHSSLDAAHVVIGDQEIPLESDISATLAYALDQSPLWKFSLSGLFQGEHAGTENRLLAIRPHRADKIPVVFVHGTASNPAYWAEMFNTLLGDPLLREHMQFWFFQYSTGNPILYTAMTLRDALQKAVDEIDPQGTSEALRHMVVVGHSQGSLVTKLMAVEGSAEWFTRATGRPMQEFGFDEEGLALLHRAFDFEPVEYVDRVVFLAGPHRGSFLAANWYSRLVAKLIAVPGEMQGLATSLFKDQTKLPPGMAPRIPTSLDNMNPDNPLIHTLVDVPLAPGIVGHSIIAIGDADADDPEALALADDGVVAYSSAHIEGVESEFLVACGHSCQGFPSTIQEVRRILREHLAANGITGSEKP